jgi:hypothetical protein
VLGLFDRLVDPMFEPFHCPLDIGLGDEIRQYMMGKRLGVRFSCLALDARIQAPSHRRGYQSSSRCASFAMAFLSLSQSAQCCLKAFASRSLFSLFYQVEIR